MNTLTSRCLVAVAAAAAAASVAVLSAGTPAFAGGNGAITEGQHVKGADALGLVVLDFNPGDSPTLPAGCWATSDMVIVSTTGNAVEHDTISKDGDEFWFTTTYAGDAAVYRASDVAVSDDQNMPATIADGAAPLYVGYLTTWFGFNQNNQNNNSTVTASFHGTSTSATGEAVSLNGGMHYTTNANGVTTVTNERATC